MRAWLAGGVLLCAIGLSGCPWFARLLPERAISPARAAWLEHCAFCHGTLGRGDGDAAARLPVPPADFSSGYFKLRSTPSGQMPTDDDLLGTINRGVGGSGMPGFAHLPPGTKELLVSEVKRLARPRDGGESYFETRPVTKIVTAPLRPVVTQKTLAEGKRLYVELGCPACHGAEGRGDGSSASELKDYAKRPLAATDFTLGVYMSGADPRQIYLRIATGLSGTPMPEYGEDLLNATQRWALVDYLLSLAGEAGTRSGP